MKIKMLTNQVAFPDGVRPCAYKAGETYDLPDWLAYVFIDENCGEEIGRAETEDRKPGSANRKNSGPAPENKGRGK